MKSFLCKRPCMSSKYVILLIIFVLAGCCSTSCTKQDAESDASSSSVVQQDVQLENLYGVPDEVMDTISAYLTAYLKSSEEMYPLLHFEDEKKRQEWSEEPIRILKDYELLSVDKLTSQLYVVKIHLYTEYKEPIEGEIDPFECTLYHYVVEIDDKWWYVISIAEIPESIRKDVDFSDYEYDEEGVMTDDSIIFEIKS